jgi:hypothetical protein
MKKRAAVVLAALLLAGNAFAESKEEIEIRNAQTRFEEGLSLADKGEHEEARVKFVQAYAVLKSSKVLYNLAIAEKKTNHPVECIKHFRVFLKDPTITPDLRARAEQIIAELSKGTSRVEITATPGADVRIDGETVGRAPFDEAVDVSVGHHTVSASLDANNKSGEVDCTAGQTTKIDVAFPNYQAPLQTQANPARIAVPVGLGIGAIAGFAIGIGFGVASGGTSDDVIASAGSHPCWIQTSVACDEHQKLISKGETQRTVSWIGYVAGGALAVAAVVTFFVLPKRIPVQPKVGQGFVGLDFQTEF